MNTTEKPVATPSDASKRRTKPPGGRDVCVYAYEGDKWILVDLDRDTNPDQIVAEYAEKGTVAVTGRKSIGAPEGAPGSLTKLFIAVAQNHFGTGKDVDAARRTMVSAGGKFKEPHGVFLLPSGATKAWVTDLGEVMFEGGNPGPMTFVKGFNGYEWTAPTAKMDVVSPDAAAAIAEHHDSTGEPSTDAEQPAAKTPGKRKSKKTEQQLKDEMTAKLLAEAKDDPTSPLAAKPAKPAKPAKAKKAKPEPQPEIVPVEPTPEDTKAQGPVEKLADIVNFADAAAKKAAAKRAAKKAKPEPEVAAESAQEPADEGHTEGGQQVVGLADETGVASEPKVSNFLLFVGSNFYSKDNFVNESAKLGISRRMPSHRLPKDLVPGKSRVFVAAAGQRRATEENNTSEVFGYFIPQRIEFIGGPDGGQVYADIIAELKLRQDTRIVDTVEGEAERGCGFRQLGGTYLVVDNADSPLHILDKPASFIGNHFRGLMRLDGDQSGAFMDGGDVAVLIEECCMNCGAKFKCAPDGHARAERERRRIDKGEAPKWLLKCGRCRAEDARTKAAERKALTAAQAQADAAELSTVTEGDAN